MCSCYLNVFGHTFGLYQRKDKLDPCWGKCAMISQEIDGKGYGKEDKCPEKRMYISLCQEDELEKEVAT